jgi:hypothetical protein
LGDTGIRFGPSGILLGDGDAMLVDTLCGDAGTSLGESAGIRFGDGTTPSGSDDGILPLGECGTCLGDGVVVLLGSRCGDSGTRFGEI